MRTLQARRPRRRGSMSDTTTPDMSLIHDQLTRARKIWRLSEVLSRGFLFVIALLLVSLLFCALDNLLRLPGFLRPGLSLALAGGGIVTLLVWVLHPLLWKLDDQATAVYRERKLGERENLLINA